MTQNHFVDFSCERKRVCLHYFSKFIFPNICDWHFETRFKYNGSHTSESSVLNIPIPNDLLNCVFLETSVRLQDNSNNFYPSIPKEKKCLQVSGSEVRQPWLVAMLHISESLHPYHSSHFAPSAPCTPAPFTLAVK